MLESMAGDGSQPSSSKPVTAPPSKPTVSLPPRASVDSFLRLGSGFSFDCSPGPMTLVSSFFSDQDDCKSFSQLLAGAMGSPSAGVTRRSEEGEIRDSDEDDGFRQKRSDGSPIMGPRGFFSIGQGSIGLTQRQTLTVQAGRSDSGQLRPDNHLSSSSKHSNNDVPEPNQNCQLSSYAAHKPADDGFSWRKYGQKQVKGSEFPRSYYKCTKPSCPVKKKIERSSDGCVIDIIYKGQHNHQPNKRNKKTDGNSNLHAIFELSGSSDSEEEKDEDERDPQRRSSEIMGSSAQREPKIAVQTTTEIDVLEDGYKWRKYGQKIVKAIFTHGNTPFSPLSQAFRSSFFGGQELLQMHNFGMPCSEAYRARRRRPESRDYNVRRKTQPRCSDGQKLQHSPSSSSIVTFAI